MTITNNVVIGANSAVNKAVAQENVVVVGIPAKLVSHNGRLEWNKGEMK